MIGNMAEQNKKNLKNNGNVVVANYLKTSINYTVSYNREHPYNIECEWKNNADGNIYFFKSENLWINPEPIIKERNIKTFNVYTDKKKMKKYYVDVSSVTDKIVDLR